jgi:hypothetical protein
MSIEVITGVIVGLGIGFMWGIVSACKAHEKAWQRWEARRQMAIKFATMAARN